MVAILNYELPPWVLISVSFCLFIAIFLLEHFRKIALRHESANSQSNVTVECSSPDCVRCNKTRSILERSQQRLHVYSNKDIISVNDDVILALLKDIQLSLDQISQSTSKSEKSECDVIKLCSSPDVLFVRGLREQSIVSHCEFPGLDILTDNYDQIKLEFMHLYRSPLPETEALWKVNTTDKGKWEIAQLIDQGSLTKASTLCPLTVNFLWKISSVMCNNVFGNAAFSVVHPNTIIEKHCGSTNCRVRCHLGLQVPKMKCCTLEVDGTHINWEEGEILCFNDAFPHAVFHKGDQDSGVRVILMVDLWHPDITESQRKLIDFSFSSSEML